MNWAGRASQPLPAAPPFLLRSAVLPGELHQEEQPPLWLEILAAQGRGHRVVSGTGFLWLPASGTGRSLRSQLIFFIFDFFFF